MNLIKIRLIVFPKGSNFKTTPSVKAPQGKTIINISEVPRCYRDYFYNLNIKHGVKLLKQFDHYGTGERANISLMHNKEVRKYLRK